MLSYVLAALASYTALDLADRVVKSGGATSRRLWLAGGATVMGLGIWSMHFTGMLAYDFSMPVAYGAYLTAVSALVAVAASGVALFVVSRRLVNARRLMLGGTVMGLGIVSMHYLGMEAMRMPVKISYYPPLVALSGAIAIGASLAALALVTRFSRGVGRAALHTRIGGSLVLGAAIAGMHYTGMAAARFGSTGASATGSAFVDRASLSVAVGAATLLILGAALVGAMVDRRFSRQAGALAETEALYSSLFEQSVDALLVHDTGGRIVDCNSEACRSLGYTREELLSRRIGDLATNLLGEGSEGDEQSLWQRAMQSEPGRVAGIHEGEHVRKDGTRFPVEVRVGRVDYRGERMILAAARDVTDRKRVEENHRAVVDTAPDAIITMTGDGLVRSFNQGAERIFGYGADEVVGGSLEPLIPERMREAHERGFRRYTRTGESRLMGGAVELAGLRKSGEEFPLELSLGELRGEERLFIGIIRDITERKAAEEGLRQSEERYRAVIERTSEGVCLLDFETRRVLESNRALEAMLGYEPGGLEGRLADDFVVGDDEDMARNLGEISRRGSLAARESRYRRRDGSVLEVEASGTRIPYGDRSVACAIIRDITGRKRLEQELEHRAYHDELTGLPNRALFIEHLARALSDPGRPGALAVLFLDLDNFKFVNDSLSHEAGDRLLVELAGRLRSCLRRADSAARLGGDEFTVLIEAAADAERAVAVAERIARSLEQPFLIDGRELLATFSIGIALSESGIETPEELLRNADTAMYRAKESGRARYEIFDASMNDRALERLELETDLRRAVERDEIEVYYQPKVSVRTGEIYGVEALARWRRPGRGLVSPASFIHIAEETGLISSIGERVLERACEQTRLWQRRYGGTPRTVCVNLSARQLRSPGLVVSVRDTLARSGLAPDSLVLEITETVAVDDIRVNAETLRALKDLGVRLAVDDFGKGYSSLAYLKRLPVDLLKIDRTFVSGSGDGAADMMLVEAIMSFARALGLTVTAEGVETAEQFAALRGMGCDLAQGYYLSRPLPASGLESLLEAGLPLSGLENVENLNGSQSALRSVRSGSEPGGGRRG